MKSRGLPLFDENDSTPIETSKNYHLKLCFCPLCECGKKAFGKKDSRGIVSWQHICRIILYSLTIKYHPREYFSLKTDILWFIVDHWFLFSELSQIRTIPNKWKKSLLDALSHSNLFQKGDSKSNMSGCWKLTNLSVPWDENENKIFKFHQNKQIIMNDQNTKPSVEVLNKINQYFLYANRSFQNMYNLLNSDQINYDQNNILVSHQMNEIKNIITKTDQFLNFWNNENN